MVCPMQECSPFSGDGDFRSQVIEYIKKNFADFLGKDVALLDLPNGLDLIQAKYPLRPGAHTLPQAYTRPAPRPKIAAGVLQEEVLAVC